MKMRRALIAALIKLARALGFSQKLILFDLLTLALNIVLALVGPWWIFAPISWVAGFARVRQGESSMIPPALAAGGTWLFYALLREIETGFLVSKRIGGLLNLHIGSWQRAPLFIVVFVLVTLLAYLMAQSGALMGARAVQKPSGK